MHKHNRRAIACLQCCYFWGRFLMLFCCCCRLLWTAQAHHTLACWQSEFWVCSAQAQQTCDCMLKVCWFKKKKKKKREEFFVLHKHTRHFLADSVNLSLHCTRISSGYFCDRKQTLACFGVFSVCIFKSISYCPLVVAFWFVFLFLVSFSFVF